LVVGREEFLARLSIGDVIAGRNNLLAPSTEDASNFAGILRSHGENERAGCFIGG